jgi:predicted nucleic acid-binding protein
VSDLILIDTSVWVSHLRSGEAHLASLLEEGGAASHPFVIGELACGSLKRREEILRLLQALPICQLARQDEILDFIEAHKLMGKGLGYVDMHLLASAMLSGVRLWTFDKSLAKAAKALGVNRALH